MALTYDARRKRRKFLAVSLFFVSLLALGFTLTQVYVGAWAQSVRPPASAVENAGPGAGGGEAGPVDPATAFSDRAAQGGIVGAPSDSDLWRDVRRSGEFNSSSLGTDHASLILSTGEQWRSFRNGPLSTYGVYALGGMFVVLVLFFLLRGRIRIEHGRAGETIERFNTLERFGHWLLAVSFIVLAITGLNVSYGRYLFLGDGGEGGLMSKELFAQLSIAGKWAHNHVAAAFIVGLALVFVMWVLRNIPNWTDVKWMLKGGGLFVKGVHPDSYKFNAGQKLIFWSTILGGASLSLSGVALMFPGETAMMAKTFAVFNDVLGTTLPTELSVREEMQLQASWHAIVAFVMIAVIVAHIYIGSLGMEGAFAAMGSGQVDLNWAKEHHNLWVDEVQGAPYGSSTSDKGAATPAE